MARKHGPVEAPPAEIEVSAPDVPLVEGVEVVAEAPAEPDLAFVTVHNTGTQDWYGTDFAAGGDAHIAGGSVGRVTRRKAEQLVVDYAPHAANPDICGPFEIVEG